MIEQYLLIIRKKVNSDLLVVTVVLRFLGGTISTNLVWGIEKKTVFSIS